MPKGALDDSDFFMAAKIEIYFKLAGLSPFNLIPHFSKEAGGAPLWVGGAFGTIFGYV